METAKERGKKGGEKPGEQQLRVENQTRRRTTPPNGPFGESEIEKSRGLDAASLNINFCQRTRLSLQRIAETPKHPRLETEPTKELDTRESFVWKLQRR